MTSAVMFYLDAGIATVVLLSVPLLAIVSSWFRKRILVVRPRVQRKTNSRITASFNESIMGDRTSKVFVRERENQNEFESH